MQFYSHGGIADTRSTISFGLDPRKVTFFSNDYEYLHFVTNLTTKDLATASKNKKQKNFQITCSVHHFTEASTLAIEA